MWSCDDAKIVGGERWTWRERALRAAAVNPCWPDALLVLGRGESWVWFPGVTAWTARCDSSAERSRLETGGW